MPKMTSSNVRNLNILKELKDSQFAVIEDERKHNVFTFNELESENVDLFFG